MLRVLRAFGVCVALLGRERLLLQRAWSLLVISFLSRVVCTHHHTARGVVDR